MTRIVGAVLALVWAVAAVADERLPTHPDVVAGSLENGVQYRILSHAVPPGRVSLRLHLPIGSLNETDDERGYAHLLEHVAFAGSENFAPGELIPFFEAMGLTIGQHQNAVTSLDRTVYMLDLPDTDDETLSSGLTFLADVLGRLEIADAGVAQEREIVLAERRTGLGPAQRLMEQWVPRVLAGSLAAERMVFGTEATVRAATAERLESFYRRWYTTGNATVVFVGDVPVERARALIDAAFGELPAAPATDTVDVGSVRYEDPFAVIATDAEAGPTEAMLVRIGPPREPVTTLDVARARIVESLAFSAFNRRLSVRVASGEAAYQRGRASAGSFFGAGWIATAGVMGDADDWRAMVADIATEVDRARTHGFGAAEVDAARTSLLAGARQFAQAEATLPSQVHASIIATHVHEGDALQSAAQRLAVLESVLSGITVDEVSAAFRALYGPQAMAVLLLTKTDDALPTEPELLEVALDAFALDAVAQAERERPTELLAQLPEPGTVATESVDDETGVYGAWFDNGVHFHHRRMDERENHVSVRITLAGGVIEETAETAGYTYAAAGTLRRFATRTHSSVALRDLMVGRTVSMNLYADADAVFLDVSGTPDALEHGLQLAHLVITEPLIEPVAFGQWQRAVVQMLEANRTNAGAELSRIHQTLRYPADDPRWRPPEPAAIAALDVERVQAWLDALFARAPIDIAVVGDIERADALALALRYLGSLASRERIGPTLFADLRDVPPPPPVERVVTIESATPQAVVRVGFAGADDDAVDEVRALSQAARILSSRMARRIREEEGLVYNVGASHAVDEALDGFSTFSSATSVEPAHAERVADIIEEMFAAFAADGPTDDEVAVARRQFDTNFDETVRDPGYWARRLADHAYRKRQPSVSAEATRAGYRALTAETIHGVFKRYHGANTHFRLIVTPAGDE